MKSVSLPAAAAQQPQLLGPIPNATGGPVAWAADNATFFCVTTERGSSRGSLLWRYSVGSHGLSSPSLLLNETDVGKWLTVGRSHDHGLLYAFSGSDSTTSAVILDATKPAGALLRECESCNVGAVPGRPPRPRRPTAPHPLLATRHLCVSSSRAIHTLSLLKAREVVPVSVQPSIACRCVEQAGPQSGGAPDLLDRLTGYAGALPPPPQPPPGGVQSTPLRFCVCDALCFCCTVKGFLRACGASERGTGGERAGVHACVRLCPPQRGVARGAHCQAHPHHGEPARRP